LEEVFDVSCIVSDDKIAHFLDARGDGSGFPFDDGFTPAGIATFCGDFAEEPARCYLEELNSFDFHIFAFDLVNGVSINYHCAGEMCQVPISRAEIRRQVCPLDVAWWPY
jgi:hypothetical protein